LIVSKSRGRIDRIFEMLKTALALAATFVVGLSAYFVLVVDVFAPRSELKGYFAAGSYNKVDLSHIGDWDQAAKATYGPFVQTRLNRHDGVNTYEVLLNDETVESRPFPSKLDSALGVFSVDGPHGAPTAFPFVLALGDSEPSVGRQTATEQIKLRLGNGFAPAALLSFDDGDWKMTGCHRLGATLAVFFAVEQQRLCFVERTDGRGPLLIGAAIMDRSWARPFARRSCRTLSSAWLAAMLATATHAMPSYVGCLLLAANPTVDRQNLLSAQFFEVRGDHSLAAFQR
jgi:hypothetical protein